MSERVIFLDFDGVIRIEYLCTHSFDKDIVDSLVEFCRDIGAKIVVSSMWRHQYRYSSCLSEFTGIPEDLFHDNPTTPWLASQNRAAEIDLWMKCNGFPKAVAIDDQIDLFNPRCRTDTSLVLTDPEIGLTRRDMEIAKLYLEN